VNSVSRVSSKAKAEGKLKLEGGIEYCIYLKKKKELRVVTKNVRTRRSIICTSVDQEMKMSRQTLITLRKITTFRYFRWSRIQY